ncbi:uncharacterized protein LOC132285615 [Cornus florida]|uniref:uncharacterized protein LOC132285615 n=1 Tax=Cornus florida TaxID=4283 RepID=UPI00289AEB4B|nr:uncharacterized protein LOC132285615 [Cornus florida]
MTEFNPVLRLNQQTEGFGSVCDPFSGPPNYTYTPEKCSKDSIQIGEIPNVLQRFTCYEDFSTGNCIGDGRFLPEASYMMVRAYSRSIQNLINIFPDLQSLTQCSFVNDAFMDIFWHQCEPFKASSRMLWASMLSLSIVMVVLLLLWVAKAYQNRGGSFSVCSIIPRPT